MTQTEMVSPSAATQTFKYIPIALVDDPEHAMRSDMSQENINDLVMSIKQVGLLEPIVVFAKGERYEVVAGHRRITACEIAGLQEVPCHIVSGTQEQVEVMKIHENLVRQDVNPWDEATHYARLITDMKLTPGKIANLTNRSDVYVRERLKILQMESVLQDAVRTGTVGLGVAQELHKIKDPAKLQEMMHWAVGHGITREVAKRWVEENQPTQQKIAGTIPDDLAGQAPTPASEQHTECFYCLQPVRLWDALTVMVHDACGAQRMTEAEDEASAGAEAPAPSAA